MAHKQQQQAETAQLFQPSSAEEIVVKAQDILALDPHPDSSSTALTVLARLREVLDSPEALEVYENVMARREGGYRAGDCPAETARRRFVG